MRFYIIVSMVLVVWGGSSSARVYANGSALSTMVKVSRLALDSASFLKTHAEAREILQVAGSFVPEQFREMVDYRLYTVEQMMDVSEAADLALMLNSLPGPVLFRLRPEVNPVTPEVRGRMLGAFLLDPHSRLALRDAGWLDDGMGWMRRPETRELVEAFWREQDRNMSLSILLKSLETVPESGFREIQGICGNDRRFVEQSAVSRALEILPRPQTLQTQLMDAGDELATLRISAFAIDRMFYYLQPVLDIREGRMAFLPDVVLPKSEETQLKELLNVIGEAWRKNQFDSFAAHDLHDLNFDCRGSLASKAFSADVNNYAHKLRDLHNLLTPEELVIEGEGAGGYPVEFRLQGGVVSVDLGPNVTIFPFADGRGKRMFVETPPPSMWDNIDPVVLRIHQQESDSRLEFWGKLNEVNASELMEETGLKSFLAHRVIDERNARGPFQSDQEFVRRMKAHQPGIGIARTHEILQVLQPWLQRP